MFQHKSLLITYNIYMQLNNYHKLMYNKTGQKSWDKPTSNGCCHHCVVTGNAYRLSGTRPFVMYLRPEVALRMRQLALECIVRYGAHTQESKDSCACPDHSSGGVVSP